MIWTRTETHYKRLNLRSIMSPFICSVRITIGLLLFLVVQTPYVLTLSTDNFVTRSGFNYMDKRTLNNGVNFTEYGINFTNLIYEYVLVCGFEYLCNPQKLPFYVNLTIPYEGLLDCPPCSCKSDCLKYDNCCPDRAIELFLLECVDVRIMTSSKMSKTYEKKSPNRFKMINKCYSQNGEVSTSDCSNKNETIIDSLSNPPVVSNEGFSYRDKRCAECNGIANFTYWELDVDCEIFIDFNYVSSYEELIDEVEERSCSIKTKPIADDKNYSCTTFNETARSLIYTCNVTGGWKVYNRDIEIACLSQYTVTYRNFKNIFCFLCNPTVNEKQLTISRCNYTGIMETYYPELEKACESFSSSEALWPFQNIFCLLCNNRIVHNLKFKDAVVNIMKSVSNSAFSKSLSIYYRIEVIQFDYGFYINILKQFWSNRTKSDASVQNAGPVLQVEGNHKISNIAKLIEYGFATNHTFRYCYGPYTSKLLSFSNPNSFMCDCRNACLFSNNECCVNVALRVATTCFKDTILNAESLDKNGNKFLALQDCKDIFKGTQFQSRCQDNLTDDIFAFLPVYFDGITYRNFDCLICNEFYSPSFVNYKDLHRDEKPWNIEIYCNSVLQYDVLDKIMDIIHLAKRMNCSLKFSVPKNNRSSFSKEIKVKTCGYGSDLISRCNMTGKWMDYDHDIVLACESLEERILPIYNPYKNVYCFLCNPTVSADAIVSSCNETGKWDIYNSNIEKACKTFPNISSLHPYKNIFCKLCNQKTIAIPPIDHRYSVYGKGIVEISGIFGNYRNLFGLPFQYETANKEKASTKAVKCGDKEIYDSNQNRCRQLKCYPGRFLQNSTCTVLFQSATNMRYTLAYSIKGKLTATNRTMLDNLRNINSNIKESIKSILGTNYVHFSSFYLVSNITCAYDVNLESDEMLSLHIYASFSIPGSIKREDVEISLLELKTKAINFNINSENVSFHAYKDDVAYRIPSLINRWDFQQKCFVMQVDYDVKSHFTYRTSFVSKLLICDQVELEPKEFHLDAFQASLTFKPSGAIFSFEEFYLPGNGRARICRDLFNKKTSSDKDVTNIFDTIINIISLICTCISMICLFITFVTYSMFKSLRSTPGKNNMSLVAAMFFAQGFLQFGLKQTDQLYVCIIIGILIHYFWLVMFFCLNVCTFHMYRVFCHDVATFSNKNQNKTFRRYLIFCYGTPFIIVMTKLVIFYLLTRTFGYGGSTCFMSEIISYVLSFLLPILMICVFNITLFGFVIYKIKNSPKVESNASSRRDTWIYLKLFSITGITWILIIIDSFLNVSFFSVIVGILSGLQGLFIMSSYIINNRVKLLYEKMFKNIKCCNVRGNIIILTETGTESTKVSSPKVKTSEESTSI